VAAGDAGGLKLNAELLKLTTVREVALHGTQIRADVMIDRYSYAESATTTSPDTSHRAGPGSPDQALLSRCAAFLRWRA
jgi:hypothetical protein